MPTFQSPVDSATLFYRSYNPSNSHPLTLVFLHGWPMSSRMFDAIILPLVEQHRFRIIAPDRRGFGHSDWTGPSNTSPITHSTFAADLSALLEHLSPGPFIIIAASMGCGESLLARTSSSYIRTHCRGFIWLGPNIPDRCDPEVWTSLLAGLSGPGRADFITAAIPSIFRTDLGNPVGPSTLRFYEELVLQADAVAVQCTAGICQEPLEEVLQAWAGEREREQIPVLMLHGDSDAGMPLETSATVVKEILAWSRLKVYAKSGHGLYLTHAGQVVDDVLEFVASIGRRDAQGKE